MPKTWTLIAVSVHDLHAGAVEVLPAVALARDRLQIFEPDDLVLHWVLDDGPGEAGREIAGTEHAVAVVAGIGEAAIDDGDRLGRRQRARRRLELGLAVGGDAVAQLAEDRHHALDLLERRLLGRQLESAAEFRDAAGDDLDLFVELVR